MKFFQKMFADSKPQTKANPNRLQHTVIPAPLFAPWGKKPDDSYQTSKRKASQEDYFFHFLTVIPKPFFAKRSKAENDACQTQKRKPSHDIYRFHYLTSFLKVIKNKPNNKDNPDKVIPHPYMSNLLSPKSLKNDDTTTPVRMYLDTSIK